MIVDRKKAGLGALVAPVVTAAVILAAGVLWPDRVSPGEARSRAPHTEARPAAGAPPLGGPVDCGVRRCIALTFDAGPGKDTPALLDLLTREQVPATFFLLGEKHVLKHPETVRRMAAEGHEPANHTWSHRILTELDAEGIRTELARTQDAVERLTGRRPTLMRPPQGRTDREVARVSRELGLAQVLWSVTAKDYATTDSALITRRVVDAADRDGIILLHDIYDGTVPAVPGIITELKRRGYTFVTVSQLLAPGIAEPGAVYKP